MLTSQQPMFAFAVSQQLKSWNQLKIYHLGLLSVTPLISLSSLLIIDQAHRTLGLSPLLHFVQQHVASPCDRFLSAPPTQTQQLAS